MESEISDGSKSSLWRDFTKLADVRADMRVFIGGVAGGRKGMSQFINGVKEFLWNHIHVAATEEYLIALYHKGKAKPDVDLHGFLADGDGNVEEIK